MGGLMSDPEIAAGLQNPKVMKAFQDLMSGPGGPMGAMSNPAKLQEMMADPEVSLDSTLCWFVILMKHMICSSRF